ncbi:MAG TPA: hypothetical protein VME46_25500 [Acidimicrobiales bacterium]|nr:hypothetical protein [Acidimicrobiales bacterium]
MRAYLSVVEREASLLVLRDQRGEHRYLRATWHGDTKSVVLSHWADGVCTATTRLALADLPKLTGFLVAALHSAAAAPPSRAREAAARADKRPAQLCFELLGDWARRSAARLGRSFAVRSKNATILPLKQRARSGGSAPLSGHSQERNA